MTTQGFFLGKLREGKLMASTEDKLIGGGFMIFMTGMLLLYGCSNLPAKSEDAQLHEQVAQLVQRVNKQDQELSTMKVLLHNMQLEVDMTRKRGNGVALGLGRVTKRISKVEEVLRSTKK